MKITREHLKNIVREAMIEESEYQEFFKRALEKAGKSIPSMSDEEKKAFFNKIEKTWKGRGKKNERFGRGHEGPTFNEEKVSDYVQGFLSPESMHQVYADFLAVTLETLENVYETCTPPDLEKETLIDNNLIIQQLLKRSSISLTNK